MPGTAATLVAFARGWPGRTRTRSRVAATAAAARAICMATGRWTASPFRGSSVLNRNARVATASQAAGADRYLSGDPGCRLAHHAYATAMHAELVARPATRACPVRSGRVLSTKEAN